MNKLTLYTFATIICYFIIVKNLKVTTNTVTSNRNIPEDNRTEEERKEDKKMLERADNYVMSPAPTEGIPFSDPVLSEQLFENIKNSIKKNLKGEKEK